MPKTYADFCRKVGAPLALQSDCAKVHDCETLRSLHRLYGTNHRFSEPYHNQQNGIERMIKEIKERMECIADAFNVPPNCWLLLLKYTCNLLNHLSLDSLNGLPPVSVAFGGIADISPYLCFHFWEPIRYKYHDTSTFPHKISSHSGRFVGVAKDHGNLITFLVLDDETNQVVPRSDVHSTKGSNYPVTCAIPNAVAGAQPPT